MANRTTVKTNVTVKNVPTVTNAILTDILNNEMADNLKFREDVAVSQNSSLSAITVDFTGKDRVDLTRTGGSLNISVSGLGDGDVKFLLITKTAGQSVSFTGVTDITPIKSILLPYTTVLYEVTRKGNNYFARAWAETVLVGTSDTNIPTINANWYSGGRIVTTDANGKLQATVQQGIAINNILFADETLVAGEPVYVGATGLVSNPVVVKDHYGKATSTEVYIFEVVHNLNIPVDNQVINVTIEKANNNSDMRNIESVALNSFKVNLGNNSLLNAKIHWHIHDTR